MYHLLLQAVTAGKTCHFGILHKPHKREWVNEFMTEQVDRELLRSRVQPFTTSYPGIAAGYL